MVEVLFSVPLLIGWSQSNIMGTVCHLENLSFSVQTAKLLMCIEVAKALRTP